MRVITGSARGRQLITLEGTDVRPTTDRVKEAIFSIIQFEIPGAKVLDLFAGSGQLGIEALSRGANLCVFVDQSRKAHEVQKINLKNTGLMTGARVVLNSHLSFLAGSRDQFDIVLLDPPYHQGMIPDTLEALQKNIADTGIVICETDVKEELPDKIGKLKVQKTYKYGKIKLTTYRVVES